MIALVTDSNAQVPPSLVERFGITVVPLPVTVDGVEYLEGVDIDADEFYRRFDAGTPTVATAQPSPGQFAAAYDRVARAGADAILSVHIGSAVSGTINSARLAPSPVPVRIVDTGTASFAIALCAWAAAEALAAGADIDRAAHVAEATAADVGNVFVVRALDQARAGGRLAAATPAATPAAEPTAIPVLSMEGGSMRVVGQAADLGHVADLMAAHVRAAGHALRVGIGVADAAVAHMWDEVERRLAGAPEVREVVRYRVGPSVGAHTGPGTVGVMYAPMR